MQHLHAYSQEMRATVTTCMQRSQHSFVHDTAFHSKRTITIQGHSLYKHCHTSSCKRKA